MQGLKFLLALKTYFGIAILSLCKKSMPCRLQSNAVSTEKSPGDSKCDNIRHHLYVMLLMTLYRLKLYMLRKHVLIISFCLLSASSATTENRIALADQNKVHLIKAAFIYNFAKLITWPKEAFPHSHSPINLCISMGNPLVKTLKTIEGKMIKKRRLAISYTASTQEIKPCHLAFIEYPDEKLQDKILKQYTDQPVVTIGQSHKFIYQGGIINFIEIEDTIRFEVNRTAAQKVKLKISSRLLKLAKNRY